MTNLNRLKGKLKENNVTYQDCARKLEISVTSFAEKMNGKSKFKVEEAQALSNYMDLSEKERIDIFLT